MPLALRVFTSKQPPQQAQAEATEALIAELHRVIDDLRKDRDEWRSRPNALGNWLSHDPCRSLHCRHLKTEQTEQSEQPTPVSHWRRAWNRLHPANRKIAEA